MCCTHLTSGTMVAKDILQGCQPPRFSNTENWLGRDERWRHNARLMMSFVQKILVDSHHHEFVMTEDARKRCSWQCNIWPDCFTSHHSHHYLYYTIWHTQVYEKTCNVNSKIAQTMQSIWNFIVEKSTLQENGTSVIIREISDSKFIWKLGDAVQNLESAGFPGRVDSTDTGALWTSFTVMVKFFTNKCSSSLFISGNFYFPFVSGYGNVC